MQEITYNPITPYEIVLPFSKKVFWTRELTTKEHLAILKSHITTKNYKEEYARSVRSILSSCLKSDYKLENINIFEYLFIVLKIYSVSCNITKNIFFSTKDLQKNTDIKVKYIISIPKLIYDIYSILKDVKFKPLNCRTSKGKKFIVELDWPMLKEEDWLINNIFDNNNINSKAYELVLKFVKTIQLTESNTIYSREDNNFNKILKLCFDYVEDFDVIQQEVFSNIELITKKNLIVSDDVNAPRLILQLLNGGVTDFYNFIYEEDVSNIYQEIFLVQKEMGISYELPPIERRLFVEIIKKSQQKNTQRKEGVDLIPNEHNI